MTAVAAEATRALACAHCGLDVPRALVRDEPLQSFCCSACETAYGLLQSHGLGAYYAFAERRAVAVARSGRRYDEFDHAAFTALYVRELGQGRRATELYLEGVHCASCVWLVERVPLLVTGTVRVELDVRRALARIEWDAAQTTLSAIAQTLDTLGYPSHPFRGVTRDAMRRREDRAMLARIGVAGAIAGNVMLAALALYSGEFHGMEHDYEQLFRWVSLALAVPALAGPGRVFLAGAWHALRARTLHMDLPIAIALSAGFLRGAINTVTHSGPVYFDGVTMLIFLLLGGRFLQIRGQRAAADAAELLFSLAPNVARVREADGTEHECPSVALLPGMRVVVRAGESFPADGTVSEGRSNVNAATLTGESRPAVVAPGSAVFAGTLNTSAPVVVTVTEPGESSRLARLLREAEENVRRRAPIVVLADRLSGVFVGVVLALAAATFAYWRWSAPAHAWDNAMALLVVTCPCALALATPLAITSAVGRAARAGLYIKGGDSIELLARPGVLVLDKTGTVTEARTTLVMWRGDAAAQRVVLALESGSSHPLADGFRNAWPGVVPAEVSDAEHHAGGGITGTFEGFPVTVGSPAFIAARAAGATPWLAALDPTLTPVLVAIRGQVVAAAGLGDRIRTDAKGTLDALRARGWQTMLLSGDDPAVVAAVAAQLGFAPQEATGAATPEAKLAFIHALKTRSRESGRPVVMVGDGVNDAAAIAAADVGIGVHGGAEASLATADAYLTTPGLEPLLRLHDGARRTMQVIRRNIAISLGYNVLGVALAMTGLISPLVAAIMMPLSSLTVVAGSWLGRTFAPAREAA
jgi:Cu2+-exporting ATPase